MEEAAAPAGLQGEMRLPRSPKSAEVRDPHGFAAARRGRHASRGAPRHRELQLKGSPTSADSERGTR
eukprot:10400995-Alexandrium_andersonii.AAC.1